MCGLAGILRRSRTGPARALSSAPPTIPGAWLDRLEDAIAFRGPDGRGLFRDHATRPDGTLVEVALVHRRLSIIDPAGGAQPMILPAGGPGSKTTGRLGVVFNGCIYNHADLRRELTRAGHQFTSDHSDTEVLLHAWREWGRSMPARLDGMFAAALWDAATAQITLIRDRTGEKPLYWAEVRADNADDVLVFATTAAGILQLAPMIDPSVEIRVDPAGLGRWVAFGFDRDPPVLFGPGAGAARVRIVPPGAIVTEERGVGGTMRMTSAPACTPVPARDPRNVLGVDELDAMLHEAVRSRLIADVPVAGFLSGGVDSSLVAHYACKITPHFRTFSVRMNEPHLDESGFAAQVAALLGCDHTVVECGTDAAGDLERLITQIGVPLGDNSMLATHWVSRAARSEVKVALAGEGGDELFFGYDRYRVATLLQNWRPFLAMIPSLIRPDADLRSSRSRIERFATAAKHGGYTELMRQFTTPNMARLALRVQDSDPIVATAEHRDDFRVTDAPLWDFEHYLPDDLLRKVDSASMGVALEARSPFLANAVIDAALRTPRSLMMPGGERKGLLRAVARRHLPSSIVDRRKQGFAVPMASWFRTDFGSMKTLLMDLLSSTEPFGPDWLGVEVDRAFVRQLADDHLAGKRDHSLRLYMMLVLSVWTRWIASLSSAPAPRAAKAPAVIV